MREIEIGLIIDGLVFGLRSIIFEESFSYHFIRHCLKGDTFVTLWRKDVSQDMGATDC